VTLQQKGLALLRQLGEARFVFGAPVLWDLIASRCWGSGGSGWISWRRLVLNYWFLRGWIERLDCFARLGVL